jgi:hypothetical protein
MHLYSWSNAYLLKSNRKRCSPSKILLMIVLLPRTILKIQDQKPAVLITPKTIENLLNLNKYKKYNNSLIVLLNGLLIYLINRKHKMMDFLAKYNLTQKVKSPEVSCLLLQRINLKVKMIKKMIKIFWIASLWLDRAKFHD